jgi:isoleucyl-tRNA synthetase
VRQPLPAVRVAGTEAGELGPEVLRLVADELNVKEVRLGAELGELVRRQVRLNPAKLGPKYGKRMRDLHAAVGRGEYTLREDERVELAGLLLEPDEINLRLEAVEGYAVAQDGGLVAALDTQLSPELVAEGRAREIVHRVQTLRKERGLNVEDRIHLRFAGDPELESVLATHSEYVQRETLARSLDALLTHDGEAWSGEIDGLPLRLVMQRAGT